MGQVDTATLECPDRVGSSETPSWMPPAAASDDIELLALGAYAPLVGPMTQADALSTERRGHLSDGTAWPSAVVLDVPRHVAEAAERSASLQLTDEEGAPTVRVGVSAVWRRASGSWALAGRVDPVAVGTRGPYAQLRRSARDASSVGRRLLAVPVDEAPTSSMLERVRTLAEDLGADVLLMPLVGSGRRGRLDAAALVRAVLGSADLAGRHAQVLPLPLPRREDPRADAAMTVRVATAYGATHVVGTSPVAPLPGVAETVLLQEDADGSLAEYPPAVERELRRGRHDGRVTGAAVMLTGLSGSGKSTIARALRAALLEGTDRTVSLLDGDVVRRFLSPDLGFSRQEREVNVRRIGYVAGEVVRHGGVAICAPIAPYAASRADVRSMVEEHGGFLLVHVSTALEICEARDRKGLYAKARAGLIEHFTGISDPYEEPHDADLVVDTNDVSVDEAVDRVIAALATRGWMASSDRDAAQAEEVRT